MANRGCYLLLLLLALACDAKSAPVQTAALQVQVYDYTGLPPAAIQEFIARTQEILTVAGISAEVDACPTEVSTPCESQRGSFRQVVIRVVARAPRKNKGRWQHLGQSIATHDGGTYATVFLNLAEEQAAETNLSRMLVLSYAAAHEVGHLLLGDQAHTSRGLMKADWETDDFQAMAQNRFRFSPDQIKELRCRYGAGRLPGAGEDTSIATVTRGRR